MYHISGKQMAYIYPEIYDYNLPESFEAANPNLIPVVHGKHVASPPWNRSTTLVSEGGQKFTSFAKFTDFDAGKHICSYTVIFHVVYKMFRPFKDI